MVITGCLCLYPSVKGRGSPILELGVGGQAGPDDVGRVVLGPQLGTALVEEVDDEELNASVQT